MPMVDDCRFGRMATGMWYFGNPLMSAQGGSLWGILLCSNRGDEFEPLHHRLIRWWGYLPMVVNDANLLPPMPTQMS